MTLKKANMLNKLLVNVSSKVYEINYGGCGIFADFLYQVVSGKGYKCQVICLDSHAGHTTKEHLGNLRRITIRDMDSIFAYNHICLQIGNYYFDSYRCERVSKDRIFDEQYQKLGQISMDKLQYLVSLEWKWNDLYDRSQNKRLKRLLSESLERL